MTATEGLENEFVLATYQADDRWRWHVVLKESLDKKEWSTLSTFYFPGEYR